MSDDSLRVSDGLQTRIRDIVGRALCIFGLAGMCQGIIPQELHHDRCH
jgi:hypothetical protein